MKNDLFWFCLIFGLMLLIALLLKVQTLYFYTKDQFVKKFSIINVQFAGSAHELKKIFDGLYSLPGEQSRSTVKALKTWFYISFLFMPFAYGSVFILCGIVNRKMQFPAGHTAFRDLAFLQVLSWLLNVIENIYLLNNLKPTYIKTNESAHKKYLFMVAMKWLITLIAIVFSVSAICYFWLSGYYSKNSLKYLLIVLSEILLFFLVQRLYQEKNELI